MEKYVNTTVTVLHGRLVYATIPEGAELPPSNGRVFLCSDKTLVYEQFFADFGPLNLACVVRFVEQLARILEDHAHDGKLIVYHSSEHEHRRSNSAFLISCFALLHLKRNVVESYAPFVGIQPPLFPFRDAAFSTCSFPLTVLQVRHPTQYRKKIRRVQFSLYILHSSRFDCKSVFVRSHEL